MNHREGLHSLSFCCQRHRLTFGVHGLPERLRPTEWLRSLADAPCCHSVDTLPGRFEIAGFFK